MSDNYEAVKDGTIAFLESPEGQDLLERAISAGVRSHLEEYAGKISAGVKEAVLEKMS
jgi:hypothetical protein